MSSASNTNSTSSNFEAVLNAALAEYTKRTGKDLCNHPLASKFDSCGNPESILAIFQEQAQAFDKFRNGDTKLFQWLRPVVSVVHAISTNKDFSDKASHVFPPAKAIFSAIDTLISTAKDVRESYDSLVNIFECIENFLRRLAIYNDSEILLTPAMSEMIIKIMAELITVLALATKQMEQGRFKKYAKKLMGEKDIESVLDRLDRLTVEESKITTAQTLDVVFRLVNKMQVVMEDGKATTDDIRQTLVLMQELVTEQRKTRRDEFQKQVRDWLPATDPWVNQNIAHKARHDGTATWFTQGDVFKKWKLEGSLMWIHGLPGSGKSVLCSSIIEDVQATCQTGLATLAFFYFDFRDIGKQDARSLLSSLLIQFSHESDKFSQILSSRYSTHGDGTRQPSEDALLKCLKDMIKLRGQGELYIIVDALDECPSVSGYPTPRAEVLEIFQELVDLRLPHVHICVTSRPELDIRGVLEGLAVHNVSLHDQDGQNQDIFDYIEFIISSDPNIRRWREEDKQLVMTTLMKRARGMFRWVYCQIETLIRCFPTSIRRALGELPETLDGTYKQSLLRIDKQKRDFARRLFQCLVVSKRPLLVEELAEIFAIEPDADTIPTFDAHCRPEDPEEFVLSACSTLVTVVNNFGQKIVQFSHFSVSEYLTSSRIAISEQVSRFHVLPRPSHSVLAGACLSVLLQVKAQNSPLASYAAQYWVDHAQFEDVASEIQHGMKGLFDKDKPHFAAWHRLYNIDNQHRYSTPPYPVPLYYAALCGFRHLVEHLVDAHPQDVNARGGLHVTPLHAALDNGHLGISKFLLKRGADVGTRDSQSRTSLHTASHHGYTDVVSLLVDLGADPNTETDNQETPLFLASKYGRQDAARLLLGHGADPNHQDYRGLTPLRAAWQGGHVNNVRLLLEYGADTKSPDNHGKSPLHFVLQESLPVSSSPAFLEHRLDVIRLLLEHGADANHTDNRGKAPLHIVLRRGLVDVVPLLLNHDADTNRPDNHGETSLHIALRRGFIDIVPLLLNHGADANHPGNHGEIPLHIALQRGFINVVSSLLNHGADANHPDNFGTTPLHIALQLDHDETTRLLLDLPGSDNCTSLYAASQRGYDDIVGLLLNRGVDADRPDNNGWTALHAASREGHDYIVLLLLYYGADVNRSDNDGRSPLHAAVSPNGHQTVVQLLLDHGAAADHPDKDGWTPLHAASQGGYDDIARLLLDQGAAPNHQDNLGRTPLHVTWTRNNNYHTSPVPYLLHRPHAGANCSGGYGWTLPRVSKRSNNNVVRLLLRHGADVNLPDSSGLTPRHLAQQAGAATVSTSYHSIIAQR